MSDLTNRDRTIEALFDDEEQQYVEDGADVVAAAFMNAMIGGMRGQHPVPDYDLAGEFFRRLDAATGPGGSDWVCINVKERKVGRAYVDGDTVTIREVDDNRTAIQRAISVE